MVAATNDIYYPLIEYTMDGYTIYYLILPPGFAYLNGSSKDQNWFQWNWFTCFVVVVVVISLSYFIQILILICFTDRNLRNEKIKIRKRIHEVKATKANKKEGKKGKASIYVRYVKQISKSTLGKE